MTLRAEALREMPLKRPLQNSRVGVGFRCKPLWMREEPHAAWGHFSASCFQSSLLADQEAVLDSMLYVELNPVRAGLVERPEQWEHGSAHCRQLGLDGWLMPLEQVFPEKDSETVAEDYRARLYRRGAVAPEKGGQTIPAKIVADEERRGFKKRGAYLERLRHLTSGLILGSREAVADWIAVLQSQDRLPRRRRWIKASAAPSPSAPSAPEPARASAWPKSIPKNFESRSLPVR